MSEPKATPEIEQAAEALRWAFVDAKGDRHVHDARVVLRSLLPPSPAMIEAAAKALYEARGGKLTDTRGPVPGAEALPADETFLTFGKAGIEPRVAHFAWRQCVPEARASLIAAIKTATEGGAMTAEKARQDADARSDAARRLCRLQHERQELLNAFGEGPFRDGLTRDRLAAITAAIRAALGEDDGAKGAAPASDGAAPTWGDKP